MSEQETETKPATKRIVVALDASRSSLNALKAAAELATLLEAELHGLFVEDINLLRLCALPFSHEVGSYSATLRRLESRNVEREFQVLAAQMRRALAQTAISAKVNWSFQVTRGAVTSELLAASEAAHLIMLGRVGRTPGKRMGSTAQSVVNQALRPVFLLSEKGLTYPLVVVYTGSAASERALDLAATLMHNREGPLRVVVALTEPSDAEHREHVARRIADALAAQQIESSVHIVDHASKLLDSLRTDEGGTLVLPAEQADLLEKLTRSAILVP